jgi:transcriptional regulator with XRE-family HTH domain
MDIRRVLGSNMRRLRLAAGLSQEAIAEGMGVDRAYVSGIERGQQNVTLLTLHQAAVALKCRVVALVDEETARQTGPAKARAPRRPRTKK